MTQLPRVIVLTLIGEPGLRLGVPHTCNQQCLPQLESVCERWNTSKINQQCLPQLDPVCEQWNTSKIIDAYCVPECTFQLLDGPSLGPCQLQFLSLVDYKYGEKVPRDLLCVWCQVDIGLEQEVVLDQHFTLHDPSLVS